MRFAEINFDAESSVGEVCVAEVRPARRSRLQDGDERIPAPVEDSCRLGDSSFSASCRPRGAERSRCRRRTVAQWVARLSRDGHYRPRPPGTVPALVHPEIGAGKGGTVAGASTSGGYRPPFASAIGVREGTVRRQTVNSISVRLPGFQNDPGAVQTR